MQKNNVKKKNM